MTGRARRTFVKTLTVALLTIVVAWTMATAALYAAMRQPPARFGAIMAHVPPIAMMVLPFRPLWMSARGGTLAVGDLAPDFSLPMLHGDHVVTLSNEVREKPVVLVFGSYT